MATRILPILTGVKVNVLLALLVISVAVESAEVRIEGAPPGFTGETVHEQTNFMAYYCGQSPHAGCDVGTPEPHGVYVNETPNSLKSFGVEYSPSNEPPAQPQNPNGEELIFLSANESLSHSAWINRYDNVLIDQVSDGFRSAFQVNLGNKNVGLTTKPVSVFLHSGVPSEWDSIGVPQPRPSEPYEGEGAIWRINVEPGVDLKTVYIAASGRVTLAIDYFDTISVIDVVEGEDLLFGGVRIVRWSDPVPLLYYDARQQNHSAVKNHPIGIVESTWGIDLPSIVDILTQGLEITSFNAARYVNTFDITINAISDNPKLEKADIDAATHHTGEFIVDWNSFYDHGPFDLLMGNKADPANYRNMGPIADSMILPVVDPGEYRFKLAKRGAVSALGAYVPIHSFFSDEYNERLGFRAPENVALYFLDSQSLRITWEPPVDELVPHRYRVTSEDQANPFATVYSGSVLEFTDNMAIAGREYTVSACSSDLDSSCGVPVTITAMSAPIHVVVDSDFGEERQDTVTWDAVGAISEYRLEVSNDGGLTWSIAYEGASTSASFDVTGNAVTEYRVSACDGGWSFCGVPSETTSLYNPILPAAKPSIANYGDDTVGPLGGAFRVSESGAATYSIPIATAGGTAGVVPQVSLEYDSHSGNSVGGKGLSIAGGSAITRCRQVVQIDGVAKPLTFSEDDRFCLDGQRLLVQGGAAYGSVAASYRTEIDSFVEVVSVGGTLGHPASFVLTKKDGSTSYYGVTNDSRLAAESHGTSNEKTLTWAINEFRDSTGNPIKFTYLGSGNAFDSTGFLLDKIYYAFGADTGSDTSNTYLDFEYGDGIVRTNFIAGYQFKNTEKLESISSYADYQGVATELRNYQLAYKHLPAERGYQQNQDLIYSVTECVAQSCKNPTVFHWGDRQALNESSEVSGVLYSRDLAPGNSDFSDKLYVHRFGDFNGDGLQDIVHVYGRYHGNGSDYPQGFAFGYQLATETGLSRGVFSPDSPLDNNNKVDPPDSCDQAEGTHCYSWGYIKRWIKFDPQIVDYNADGRDDVILFVDRSNNLSPSWELFLSVPVDVDGEIEWRLERTGIKMPFVHEDMHFADLNADGLIDAWHMRNDGTLETYYLLPDAAQTTGSSRYYSYQMQANQQAVAVVDDTPLELSPTKVEQRLQAITVADFDGDGVAEIAGFSRHLSAVGRPHSSDDDGGDYDFQLNDYFVVYQAQSNGSYAQLLKIPFYRKLGHFWHAHHRPFDDTYDEVLNDDFPVVDRIKLGDFNADGLPDFLIQETAESTWQAYLNKGDLTFAPAGTRISIGSPKTLAVVPSIDGDDFGDLLWHINGKLFKKSWNNETNEFWDYTDVLRTGLSSGDHHRYSFQNMDTEPGLELVNVNTLYGPVTVYDYDELPDGHNNIDRITNGLGAETEITYLPLSAPGDHYVDEEPMLRVERCPEEISLGRCHFALKLLDPVDTATLYSELNDPFGYLGAEKVTLHPENFAPVIPVNSSMSVVSRVQSSAPAWDTLAGAIDEDAKSAVSYIYHHGRIQAAGRGFLGFRKLSTIDEQSNVVTTTEYRQDFPFIGMPVRTTRSLMPDHNGSGGGLLSESTVKYGVKSYTLGNFDGSDWTACDSSCVTSLDPLTNGCKQLGALQPFLEKSVDTAYSTHSSSGSSLVVTSDVLSVKTMENEYFDGSYWDKDDNIYAVISKVYQGPVNPGDADANLLKTTRSVNHYSPASWASDDPLRFGRLSRTAVTHTRSALGGGYASSHTLTSEFDYYPLAEGGLIKLEIVEPGDPIYELKTSYEYDVFGNKERVTQVAADGRNANGVIDLASGSVSSASRSTSWEYDLLGRYVDITKNDKGQITAAILERNVYGSSIRSRDIEGVVTESSYTPFNRPYLVWGETGAHSHTRYIDCTGGNSCPAGATYGMIVVQAGGAESHEYFDVLGRTIQTRALHFDGVSFVSSDTHYDGLNRVARKSEPYLPGEVVYWTQTSYDALGRQTTATTPHPTNPVVNRASYDGFTTTAIRVGTVSAVNQSPGPNGAYEQRSLQTVNALGQTVVTQDNLQGRVTSTFDSQGNLRTTMTHASSEPSAGGVALGDVGATITVSLDFDKLGRKIGMVDPDKGDWVYQHNGFGELIQQDDAKGNTTIKAYDSLGRQTRREDWLDLDGDPSTPEAELEGDTTWTFDQSGHGRLDGMADAISGYSESYFYDDYGRQTQNTVVAGSHGSYTSRVTFDRYSRVFQRFDGSDTSASNTNGSAGWQYQYRSSGHVEQINDVKIQGGNRQLFWKVHSMTARGQLAQVEWGNGAVTTRSYEPERGIPTKIMTGYGLFTAAFDPTLSIQYTEMEFDDFNNLISKHNRGLGIGVNQDSSAAGKDLEETYSYDGLNRLRVQATNGGAANGNPAYETHYDSFGNLKLKSDVGQYTYGEPHSAGAGPLAVCGIDAGPHAVTSIDINNDGTIDEKYCYDRNGNLIADSSADGARSFSYTSFDKVTAVARGDHLTTFAYGPNRSRYLREDNNTANVSLSKSTLYIGSFEKIIHQADGRIEFKRYIEGGVLITDSYSDALDTSVTSKLQFLIKDYLGSTELVLGMDVINPVIADLSFDAWGKRRASQDYAQLDLQQRIALLLGPVSDTTNRGFTGHEMVDEVGIIHMNGRIYDPRLGRFLQADPFIQDAAYSQSYNRYSYGFNNPLNGTDESGYIFGFVFAAFKFIATAYVSSEFILQPVFKALGPEASSFLVSVGSFFCGPAAPACAAWGNYNIAKAHGASTSEALRSGAIAGATAFAFQQIGAHFQAASNANLAVGPPNPSELVNFGGNWLTPAQVAGQITAHSIAGGVISELQGGEFGHGFVSAGFTKGITGAFGGGGVVQRYASATVAGGTASVISGGKFKNGALTASYQFLFNEIYSQGSRIAQRERTKARTTRQNLQELSEISGAVADGSVVVTALCPKCVFVTVPVGTVATFVNVGADIFLMDMDKITVTISEELGKQVVNHGVKRIPFVRSLPPDLQETVTTQASAIAETVYRIPKVTYDQLEKIE